MTMAGYPRLSMSLRTVADNTRQLAARLVGDGIALIGVTKASTASRASGGRCSRPAAPASPTAACPRSCGSPHTRWRRSRSSAPPQPDELETAAQVADRVLLSDSGAARALGEHAPGAPVEVLLTVDLGDRREGVLPDAAPRGRGRARPPARRRAGRRRRQLRLPLRPAAVAGAVPAGRGRAGRRRRRLRRRARAVARRHLRRPAPGRLPAALSHRAALGRRPDLRLRLRQRPRHHRLERTDPVLTAAVLECYRKPPAPPGPRRPRRLRPRARGATCRRRTPGTHCWPSAAGTWSPAACARCSPARTSPARPATSACSSRPSRCARATRCRSPSTTTRWCAPSPHPSS